MIEKLDKFMNLSNFHWLTKILNLFSPMKKTLYKIADEMSRNDSTGDVRNLNNIEPVLEVVITLRPRQNGRHFPDDVFKCIFLNENVNMSINTSLKFVPKGTINNIPTLAQIMAWRRSGDKPISESMMINLLTHICITRPQWVNHKTLQLSKEKEIKITLYYIPVV